MWGKVSNFGGEIVDGPRRNRIVSERGLLLSWHRYCCFGCQFLCLFLRGDLLVCPFLLPWCSRGLFVIRLIVPSSARRWRNLSCSSQVKQEHLSETKKYFEILSIGRWKISRRAFSRFVNPNPHIIRYLQASRIAHHTSKVSNQMSFSQSKGNGNVTCIPHISSLFTPQ